MRRPSLREAVANHLGQLEAPTSPEAFAGEEEAWVPAELYEMGHMARAEYAPGSSEEELNAVLRAVHKSARKREARRFKEFKARQKKVIEDLKRQFDHAGEPHVEHCAEPTPGKSSNP